MLRPYSEVAMGQPFKHTDYRTYKKYLEPYLIEKSGLDYFETICLVREPVAWLHSWYRFRSRLAAKDSAHPAHKKNTFGISFTEFVQAYISPNPPSYANVGCQFDFVKDDKDKIGVDSLFRYENIEEFCGYMSNKLGEQLKMQYRNVSPKRSYRSDTQLVLDRLRHKMVKTLHMKPQAVPPGDLTLPPHVQSDLADYISADFDLYETVRQLR